MIQDDWYEDPVEGPLRGAVGDHVGASYFAAYAATAHVHLAKDGVAVVHMEPGNGTAYRLVVALVPPGSGAGVLADIGCIHPMSVVWADTTHGHVFQADDHGILHENYVVEKMGVRLADGWVIGRFLTALRQRLAAVMS